MGEVKRRQSDTLSELDELMSQCYEVAFRLAYFVDADGNAGEVRPQSNISDALWDEVWSWTDGLYQKWFFDTMNGRCSSIDSVQFSMEDEESYMRSFLEQVKAVKPQV